jgi:hypothetical protein
VTNDAYGTGAGSPVRVDAPTVTIAGGSGISSNAREEGDGEAILVSADSLEVRDLSSA